MTKKIKIAIVAGEESGDLLGADLIEVLKKKISGQIELIGVGGQHLEKFGLKSLFDPEDIALMGITAVLKQLPKLYSHIKKLAQFLADQNPDCLIIIDSPDFTHRVAKRVRALNPSIPIIKYIAPSVWAWRPQRAKEMRSYIDHVLVILPFEPKVMEMLDGPPSTYVGHRLLSSASINDVRQFRQTRVTDGKKHVIILPGSRRSEVRALMPDFGRAVNELSQRADNIRFILPTLPKIEKEVRQLVSEWAVKPDIVVGDVEKWQAFKQSDVALAASGTVSLELALCNIPTVLAYRADWFSKMVVLPKITIWSAALPNIIADEPIVPEYFNEYIKVGMLARQVERHMHDGPAQNAQLLGFKKIYNIMKTEQPSGEIAANVIMNFLKL
ncbi:MULTISPECIES: lipid-A-disaccharide synthase [unclassified Bartonella]|uniref:lipid-A-disaccharide synthase n=1 Tax=unclassified Bartonella TaxID=2645622 RepID=UPI0021C9694D|nr:MULTISPECIES: lipid-A-disaccharide synthase [unclassified Bartonella]UXN04584.1 lipid-A-disaccharide synthase [Bartonella sp. HY406]UXN07626.1 lipid-A-disaccharide synthase [Bartonella sp. HY761]